LLGGDKAREIQLGAANLKIRREEDEARKQFLNKNANRDDYLHLVDVFDNSKKFVFEQYDPAIPLMLEGRRKVTPGAPSIVESLDVFMKNFYSLAPYLKNIDWTNVCVAGGSVLGSLLSSEQGNYPIVFSLSSFSSSNVIRH